MADRTGIDPDGARRMFGAIGALAGDLEAAVARVRAIRAQISEPWGADETGRNFAKGKEPSAEQNLGYATRAAVQLRDLGAVGRAAVDEFVEVDRVNGSGLNRDS